MAKRTALDFGKPRLFSSTAIRRIVDDNGSVVNKNAQDLADTNVASSASFRYDPPFLGIRSTQQIPTDFSSFENHTFFSSAEVNVNVAFDRIINEYPFDGTRKEVEVFLDSLTGYEKWVFDSFPRNKGYLFFSGSSSPSSSEGTYISVKDFAGHQYPTVSKTRSGDNILDPGLNPFTTEFHIYVPAETNTAQVICQKLSGSSSGLSIALTGSASTATCGLLFGVSSGSHTLTTSMPITKGQFSHVVATFDRRPGINNLQLFLNQALVSTSSNIEEMGLIDFTTSPLIIGSGSLHTGIVTPEATLSGAIDEFRVFHSARTLNEQKLFAKKSIFATPELKLYFKFNEPSGTIGPDSTILDSSGNSLHSKISNFSLSLRNTGSIPVPMLSEKLAANPILFPSYAGVAAFNESLLASASLYDSDNPNIITKLIPDHYFLEGQVHEGLGSETGSIGDTLAGSGIPGSAEFGTSQLMSSFLYTWAKFFDEIKMMVDLFGSITHVDYDKPNFTADQFLPFLANYYGFEMPAFFVNSSIEQFIDAENIGSDISTNALALQYVQNQIWRRILTNISEIIKSKGTLHSIKSLLRSMGIDANSNFKIREFGGATKRSLQDSREDRSRVGTMLDFSGSLASVVSSFNTHGIPNNKPFLKLPYLSGSRTEVGFPGARGLMTQHSMHSPHGISNDASDGLFTSGSWTYEALYRHPTYITGQHAVTQSLARIFTTGSATQVTGSGGLLFNLVAVSGSMLTLFASPGVGGTAPTLTLPLSGADVMDGHPWSISFGRNRGDEIGAFNSSSYFLRAARQEFGSIVESYTTQSLFLASGSTAGMSDAQSVISPTLNASGTFVVIGSQSLTENQSGMFLNNSAVGQMAKATSFSGKVTQIRFWSKGLTKGESIEHARNYDSLGVETPGSNFNFSTGFSGSFEKLRLDITTEQHLSKSSASGDIELFDYSQNNFHGAASGFEPSVNVLSPERYFFSQLSPRFDEAASNNKVRIRSFQSFENASSFKTQIAPVYEIPLSEAPVDDARFSIDFSIMDALNDDIIKIFSTLDSLDNTLGNPELLFSPDYPELETLRNVYFNRLTGQVRMRQFFEFFKWFDSMLGISSFIEQLVPRKTLFLGTNFIIESHMLERPKLEYHSTDIYLGEADRDSKKGIILVQQLTGQLGRQ